MYEMAAHRPAFKAFVSSCQILFLISPQMQVVLDVINQNSLALTKFVEKIY